jgi:hypothetical protein
MSCVHRIFQLILKKIALNRIVPFSAIYFGFNNIVLNTLSLKTKKQKTQHTINYNNKLPYITLKSNVYFVFFVLWREWRYRGYLFIKIPPIKFFQKNMSGFKKSPPKESLQEKPQRKYKKILAMKFIEY